MKRWILSDYSTIIRLGGISENTDRGYGLMKRARLSVMLAGVCAGALMLGGCSRSQMNYQIAEAIGTAGMYENNEPVETPQMVIRREMLEESESEEEALMTVLNRAEALAAGYNFEEAISVLNTITGMQSRDERVIEARDRYEQGDTNLENWVDGDIPHLCFPTLIYDTTMAFDGDGKASSYATTMVTCKEFSSILQSLYDNNYILIDIHTIAANTTDERGTTSMEQLQLKLPAGKKPIVLSQDNLNYSGVTNGDGIATKLVLDEEGKVKAQYTDSSGHDVAGDFDFIPILDTFIEEHPDFSFRGARGIVSVSGSEGVFGYDLPSEESAAQNTQQTDAQSSDGSDALAGVMNTTSPGGSTSGLTEDQQQIAQISKALTDEGWSIASAGWSHNYMNDQSYDQFMAEMDDWIDQVGSLTGSADILFYPYGAEVEYPGQKLEYLLSHGFTYLCGLWGDTDFRELGDGYMRMTRRFVDGYTLVNAPSYFTGFFAAGDVLDTDR